MDRGHSPGRPRTREVLLLADPSERAGLHADLLAELRRAGIATRCQHRAAAGPGHGIGELCAGAVANGELPLLLTADQARSHEAWLGIARARAERGTVGLIALDARLDAAAPGDPGDADAAHMMLSRVLGLVGGCDAQLRPEHVCVLGARDWQAAALERLTGLGVRIHGAAEIARRGFESALCEALTIARSAAGGFVVSIDLEGLASVPGAPRMMANSLHALRDCPDLLGLELAGAGDAELARWAREFACAALGPSAAQLRAAEEHCGAHNYAPLPVVLARGQGVWLWDVAGRRYLDMMSAYSAVSLGHAHPRLLEVLARQAGRLALTSRAYSSDRLPLLLERLCELFGFEAALPVNTGLEAVETALKAARKWAYRVKGVAPGMAEIIACDGNFHGRSIAIVGLSSEAQYRDGFGPFPPGLKRIPFGDADALAAAITPNTAAFLVEPIQGEGGIRIPPRGWLARCAEICRTHGVLLIADEVQTGLGRTGKLLACAHEGVRPDGLILGKALGGGLLPVSAFLADRRVMDVFGPGDHGSTFGGNPLAAAVALEALEILTEENLCEYSAVTGEFLLRELGAIASPLVREVRGRGLFIGMELDPARISAHAAAERLLARGILTKDTHHTVLRFAPPLVIERAELVWAVEVIGDTLARLAVDEPGARRAAR